MGQIEMYTHPQRLGSKVTKELRNEAGRWLRELRERRGLSQRELAAKVGCKHYTFISGLEGGRGRIPPDRYIAWAEALKLDPQEFVHRLMSYYDPVTFGILFRETVGQARPLTSPLSIDPTWLTSILAAAQRSILPTARRSLPLVSQRGLGQLRAPKEKPDG